MTVNPFLHQAPEVMHARLNNAIKQMICDMVLDHSILH